MSRGARRAPILAVDGARELFLELLAELPMRFGVQIHAYALMSNHYHVLITSSDVPLEQVMKRLNQTFTQRLNHRCDWDGPVFRGRYHDVLVGHPAHWRHLLAYVHGNPVRAGLPHRMSDPHWTSHCAYLAGDSRWLSCDPHLDELGGPLRYSAWISAVLDGEISAPDGFEPERWGGPKLQIRAAGHVSDDPAVLLKQLTNLWGQYEPSSGPDPRHAVAIWWFRSNQVDLRATANAFGTSTSTVSRRVDSVLALAREDVRVAGWMAALSGEDPRTARAA